MIEAALFVSPALAAGIMRQTSRSDIRSDD